MQIISVSLAKAQLPDIPEFSDIPWFSRKWEPCQKTSLPDRSGSCHLHISWLITVNMSGSNSSQDFQPRWSWSTDVTDGWPDGQLTCNGNTALCTIDVKMLKLIKKNF